MVLLFCIHFIVEACADFVDIVNAATEHVSIFLPRKFEVREQAVAELRFGQVGIMFFDRGDEARMHALESRFETCPMVFAVKERFIQVLESHRVAPVARKHFKAADDVAFLQVFIFQLVAKIRASLNNKMNTNQ